MEIFASKKMTKIQEILQKLSSLKKIRLSVACKYLYEKEKLDN